MATDIENVLGSAVAARREIERIEGQARGLEGTEVLRTFLRVAASTITVAEFLLGEARSAEKFWQVRQAHNQ